MKKTLLIVALVVLALGALGVGVVLAQGGQPPVGGFGPGMMWDGETSPLHNYMEKAMADAVGLSATEFESRHDAGETFYQIALAEGYSAEEIPALMQTARDKALDAAAGDGVLSQEQANWMKSRGFGRGGMRGGFENSDCPMYDGDEAPNAQFGPGMMRGWSGQ